MAEIKVLPGIIADKIAAGEVAERPSAVVKELVENSIDAGATKIYVEILSGGIKYISVEDNGKGIKKDEIETAFLRHATSKLREIEDLEKIRTMGFRGEALASISAVASVEVISKTADAPSGTYMKVERGIAQPKEDIACNNGTIMVVENLFENVPARMKFLKKDSTEAGYISDVVSRIAMAHPEIMIKMTVDAAHDAGIWAGISGEIAADSSMTEVLLKLGVDELSVSPRAVLPVRNVVRQTLVTK